jgi:hypothetical protein
VVQLMSAESTTQGCDMMLAGVCLQNYITDCFVVLSADISCTNLVCAQRKDADGPGRACEFANKIIRNWGHLLPLLYQLL